jgi:hypothetical protein
VSHHAASVAQSGVGADVGGAETISASPLPPAQVSAMAASAAANVVAAVARTPEAASSAWAAGFVERIGRFICFSLARGTPGKQEIVRSDRFVVMGQWSRLPLWPGVPRPRPGTAVLCTP